MPNEENGRLVAVKTKFYREAVRPGGINRSGANMASDRSVRAMKADVEKQITTAVSALLALLRNWDVGQAAQGCTWAALTRDLAGLAGLHLLTEVAMHSFDCLDAVVIDGAEMRPKEAACYADALAFAQQDQCRGSDLAPFEPLLSDLERLTSRVIGRVAATAKAAR
ncbi:hypothetical protein NIM87_10145 [Devosia sp. XJ19-1]|uniref:Uncharacterized protein n=1 Tax=Devosia ureilytica TaxID=2952754 RepID=A0A9Q4FST2_9HYPH|nr:hypothetical protein [Devosia ureilytica]MCP8883860.1 hypothetical protein [Devosia ureilytica]MCP8887468.1 hypothetical protein [Devosia ureilytica]